MHIYIFVQDEKNEQLRAQFWLRIVSFTLHLVLILLFT